LLITHHIEEIVDGITHSLLIKDGKMFAIGQKEKIITSESISDLFDTPLKIDCSKRRYWAIIT